MRLVYIVENDYYKTINQVIKEEFKMSERLLLKLKRNQKIYKNGEIASIKDVVHNQDKIELFLDIKEENSNIVPWENSLDILYEDDSMLIVNKPAGMAVHPSCSHFSNSLSNVVRYYYDSIHLKKKIRIVNRLDKNTSGIVIFAKNEYIQENLIQQMKEHTFQKYYLALIEGSLEKKFGVIELPIGRKEGSIIERCVTDQGDYAATEYYTIREYDSYSLVCVTLKTGRTHQIRVHMSHSNAPVLGDTLYGNSSKLISRQALHSCKVRFIHPSTKQELLIEAPIPKDMEQLL